MTVTVFYLPYGINKLITIKKKKTLTRFAADTVLFTFNWKFNFMT